MAGNSFGRIFRITTWGESHGKAVGVVIDGCPPGLPISAEMIQTMMDRRRPGRAPTSTLRRESDQVVISSGVFEGVTTGTPIAIHIENRDADSSAYQPYAEVFRPGHGDFTYQAKYGIRDWRGGGRASARETVGRVAGGAVAKAVLEKAGVAVRAYTLELGGVRARTLDFETALKDPFGCPDREAAQRIAKRVVKIKKAGDSLGGIVEIRAEGVPPGLGEPVFEKLDASLAAALMSIGAVKGVEFGSGFQAAAMTGSQHNESLTPQGFASNHAGGILAGISNGDIILARVAVKPIPSIRRSQRTVDIRGNEREITVEGRHDIAAIPRINVVCEAMFCLVLVDHLLRQKALNPI